MKKRTNRAFGVFVVCIFLAINALAQNGTSAFKVVIDAGHGGNDPGTLGKHSREKDVTLAIGLHLGRLIAQELTGVEVVYTRKTDVFIELFRRSQIANEHKADLFISIHCNGTASLCPRGVESWVMGLHKSKENLDVAKKENASILMEDSYSQYDGFDPNSPEATVIFSLYQNVFLDRSLDIASRVQEQLTRPLGLTDRGVKQAGFWVLYKTAMPGLLIETGFLCNKEDENLLTSEEGQQKIALAILEAVRQYKESYFKSTSSPALTKSEAGKATHSSPRLLNEPPERAKETAEETRKNEPARNTDLVFGVQIYSSDKKLSLTSPLFKGQKEIWEYYFKGSYKYAVGKCDRLENALALQKELQQKGFKDAFVIAIYKGERIPVQEAKKLQGN